MGAQVISKGGVTEQCAEGIHVNEQLLKVPQWISHGNEDWSLFAFFTIREVAGIGDSASQEVKELGQQKLEFLLSITFLRFFFLQWY